MSEQEAGEGALGNQDVGDVAQSETGAGPAKREAGRGDWAEPQETKRSHTEKGWVGQWEWAAQHSEAPRPGVQAGCRDLKGGLQAFLIPGPALLGPEVCPLLSPCPLLTPPPDLVQPASSTSKEPACGFHPAPALPAGPGRTWRTAAAAQHLPVCLGSSNPLPKAGQSEPSAHSGAPLALSGRKPSGASREAEDRGL